MLTYLLIVVLTLGFISLILQSGLSDYKWLFFLFPVPFMVIFLLPQRYNFNFLNILHTFELRINARMYVFFLIFSYSKTQKSAKITTTTRRKGNKSPVCVIGGFLAILAYHNKKTPYKKYRVIFKMYYTRNYSLLTKKLLTVNTPVTFQQALIYVVTQA